ncbi:M90 family metallopeptidase [Marinifilum caeruleilacunae]|jgi:Mlc titration factor MtfA (ptsG expression regulator)|uniref:Peptidase n=1 Tax=Marinifilum caeruleilacunae TaxID=2499076 RepID=A0ABX1WVP8_9BACT|nr:M90 family metallopeptidase [Marinifilum caeruleilacunae]NOU60176.1 peptidase [Marinifilum caeruleilacunae]
MKYIAILSIGILAYLLFKKLWSKKDWKSPKKNFPSNWRNILVQKVSFYNSLNTEEKTRFEYKVQEFLLNCRITGIHTEVDDTDRILVAASAIIPVFEFPNWKYTNLFEVLLYPNSFNDKFETNGDDARILGMVGTGYMEGKMILSKPALLHGFSNESDKKNTAIHEFVHLIDKMDGTVDGLPSILMEKQYSIPWLDLISRKIEEIYEEKSDINPYGATNKAEFFAVISEYFFERPKLLASAHPELYQLLEEIFNQNMSQRKLLRAKQSIGRNSPCPCGSGLKFKKCCGKSHY